MPKPEGENACEEREVPVGVPSKCAADSERASQRTPPLVSLAAQSTTRVSFREKMAANLYTFKYTDDRNPAARRTSIAADAGGPAMSFYEFY